MNAWISGIGKTRFGPTSRTLVHLANEAIRAALNDSGLNASDIDALIVSNFLAGPNESQLHLNSVLSGLLPGLQLPAWRVEAACASGGVALHNAVCALSAYERILVVGVERLSGLPAAESTRHIGMAGDALLDQSQGLNFPASYALVAQMHMRQYGTRLSDFDAISLKNHQNARHNPKAHFHAKHVQQADIDAGVSVASPIRLFDCCPISDGAAAVVVTRKPTDERSVRIAASAVATDVISLAQRAELTTFAATRAAAARAYAQAGVTAGDIDLFEVHDCFTIAELIAMEDLGIAQPGEAAQMIRAGETCVDGAHPVNPSGGLKAGGHAIGATGIGQAYECARQLRLEAGDAQLARRERALTHSVGGVGGTCAIHVLEAQGVRA